MYMIKYKGNPPSNCFNCPAYNHLLLKCKANDTYVEVTNIRPDNCSLIEDKMSDIENDDHSTLHTYPVDQSVIDQIYRNQLQDSYNEGYKRGFEDGKIHLNI